MLVDIVFHDALLHVDMSGRTFEVQVFVIPEFVLNIAYLSLALLQSLVDFFPFVVPISIE